MLLYKYPLFVHPQESQAINPPGCHLTVDFTDIYENYAHQV